MADAFVDPAEQRSLEFFERARTHVRGFDSTPAVVGALVCGIASGAGTVAGLTVAAAAFPPAATAIADAAKPLVLGSVAVGVVVGAYAGEGLNQAVLFAAGKIREGADVIAGRSAAVVAAA